MKLIKKIKKLEKHIEKIAKKAYLEESYATHEAAVKECEKCHKSTHELYTKPQKILDELKELYIKEQPKLNLYLTDQTAFYKWIVEEIKAERMKNEMVFDLARKMSSNDDLSFNLEDLPYKYENFDDLKNKIKLFEE